ncbi:hypothetical protein [Microcoleus sp. FACHB-831]|uniref:hypothetical protein n=1 Tax=Microcoleus sp. FACHB-831 TaxID=2692827 RepID=UPI001682F6D7|nr:hypothetical protein [Microcoleus sp. FACHB-831]
MTKPGDTPSCCLRDSLKIERSRIIIANVIAHPSIYITYQSIRELDISALADLAIGLQIWGYWVNMPN